MKYQKRKRTRLKEFDYSQDGAYFITICTKDRKNTLGHIPVQKNMPSVNNKTTSKALTVGQGLAPAEVILSKCGKIAKEQLQLLETRFSSIKIDHYVIMPNHIHIIIIIQNPAAEASPCPTISDVICAYKSLTSRLCNKQGHTGTLFQTSFHDHIIRNEQDYMEIWKYIENNPAQWEEDVLYTT